MADFSAVARSPLDVIAASRGPENLNQSMVVIDMDEKISTYQPKSYPLVVLTNRMKDKKSHRNFKFEYLEGDEYPRDLELTGNALVGDTGLDVTAGVEARAAAGYVYLNTRTREVVQVVSTASGAITVVRAVGGGSQSDMATGDILTLLGPVFEDGSASGAARSTKERNLYNYLQIIKTKVSVTGRDKGMKLYGGDDLVNQRKKAAIEHAKSLELFYWFGQRGLVTTGTHYATFMGGLEWAITDNVWDLTGVNKIDERSFDEFLEVGMRDGGGGNINGTGTKYLLASSRLITEINWFAKSQLQYRPLDDTIGFSAMEYKSPHGKVEIVHAPILDRNHNGWGALLDLNELEAQYFEGRDTQLQKNIQANDVDGEDDQYFTDGGIKVTLQDAHSWIKGLS
jgi:uncharacterized protein DUF5309